MSVTRISAARQAHIDLATVRETLSLIQDDLAVDPRHRALCAAIDQAIAEVDAIEARPTQAPSGRLAMQFASRFEPWTPDA
ncbi:MAG: hypothetical protein ACKVP7_20160 [Hyphomicrobiaceae bacterium]